ncbi:MAG TPA: MFS transporter [Vicinamibacterales bacterium]|jgi:DHA1 family multidrug resistance protein-like MFS transporter|nr:MFS transporter [Vicinamibacterales bacterium]
MGFTGFTLVMPFLPLYFQQLGVTDVGEIAIWSGVSLGVTPGLTAILAPFWGRLADRYGRKIMVERSIASFVVIMTLTAYVDEAWQVFALRAVQGIFAGYGSLTLTMAAQSAPPGRMAQAIGTVQTAQRLGPALGPVIGGVVAGLVGLRRAFLVTASFYVVALLLVFFVYRDVDAPDPRARRSSGRISFRDILAFENFLLLMSVIFTVQFADRTFGPVLPLFLAELDPGLSASRVALLAGLLFSMSAGAGAAGNQVAARLLATVRPRRLLVICAGVAAAASLCYALAGSVWLLFLITPIFGAAIGLAMTCAYATAGSVIPAGAGGTGFGVLTTASLLGLALSPLASGLVAAISIRAVFFISAIAMGIVAVLVRRVMIEGPIAAASQTPVAEG